MSVDVTLPNYTSTLIGTNSAGNVGIGRTPTAYGSFKVLDLAGSSGAIQKVIHTGKRFWAKKATESLVSQELRGHLVENSGTSMNLVRINVFAVVNICLVQVQNSIPVVDGQVFLCLQIKNL